VALVALALITLSVDGRPAPAELTVDKLSERVDGDVDALDNLLNQEEAAADHEEAATSQALANARASPQLAASSTQLAASPMKPHAAALSSLPKPAALSPPPNLQASHSPLAQTSSSSTLSAATQAALRAGPTLRSETVLPSIPSAAAQPRPAAVAAAPATGRVVKAPATAAPAAAAPAAAAPAGQQPVKAAVARKDDAPKGQLSVRSIMAAFGADDAPSNVVTKPLGDDRLVRNDALFSRQQELAEAEKKQQRKTVGGKASIKLSPFVDRKAARDGPADQVPLWDTW